MVFFKSLGEYCAPVDALVENVRALENNVAHQQSLVKELKASAEWEKSKLRVQAGLVATISGELAAKEKAYKSVSKRAEKEKMMAAKKILALSAAKDLAVSEAVMPLRQKLSVAKREATHHKQLSHVFRGEMASAKVELNTVEQQKADIECAVKKQVSHFLFALHFHSNVFERYSKAERFYLLFS